jgi:hypothetical protein
MTASIVIEEESGISTGRIHPHNGYFAGDFRDVPVRLPAPSIAASLQGHWPSLDV